MPQFIDREEYEAHRQGSTVPDPDEIGLMVIKRTIESPVVSPERYASQVLAQIVEISVDGNYGDELRTVTLFELSDDGQEVVSGEMALELDSDGNIIDDRNRLIGYLLGGFRPDENELFVDMESLMVPVVNTILQTTTELRKL